MRSTLSLAASAAAGVAAIVASLDGDADIVPFFVGLTFLGGVQAWAAHEPFVGTRRSAARGITLLWVGLAIWAGVLLIWYQAMGSSGPPPGPEATYLGLTASVYHLIGLFGGGALVAASGLAPGRWLCRAGDRPAQAT
jgi:hypothetical protein